MKKTFRLLVLIALLISGNCFAQFQMHWYSQPSQNNEKYFLSVGYGVGQAYWYSQLTHSSIYDKQGTTLETGTFKFRANNATTFYDLNVLCPINNFRLGLGMNFEKFFLTKLEVKQTVTTSQVILYDESFRFDKMFVQCEFPFWPTARSRFSLSANGRVGFFSFNNVDRINLFGSDAMANSMFFTVSPVADIQLYPGFFFFLQPMAEYKYFKNPAVDPGGSIVHNIWTYSGMIGIRIDPSMADPYK
ncbi:MAG: hypothetical protein NT084_08845 [Bacteroidetes bacterium]|nr:hypothetical protein [Bacteroidota bacterium]